MADTFPLVPDRIAATTEEFSTNIVEFENGEEQRSPNWSLSKPTFKLTFNYLTTSSLTTLRSFFKEKQGSYMKFYFVNHLDGLTYECRFKSDKFPITHTNVAVHNLELELKVC